MVANVTELFKDLFHSSRCCIDAMSPDYYWDASPDSAPKDTIATIEHIKTIDPKYEIVSPIITPRFAPSCTRPLLHFLGALSKSANLLVQMHRIS